ncbi:CidA/LrgA family protein [Paenibacillus sp. CC-CFT747]|nr:CidA/LrgA family protein [Paenibacillus sp. CC-CFT747]
MIRFGKGVLQILFFILVSYGMNAWVGFMGWPVPGSILGLGFVFVLLQLKILPLNAVELGAKWLLAEMLLFFIPSAAGVVEYKPMLLSSGPQILLVVLTGTALVMGCAGLAAELIISRKGRKMP